MTLNTFFSSVFTQETDEAPELEERDFAQKLLEINISEELVLKKLQNLNPTKSQGPDGIHPRILKELSISISKPLTILFTASMHDKTIPSDWKTATVSAIHKKGDKKQPGNYRPVSLTSIVCKILESIVRNRIMEHMQINNLFSNSQ